MEYVLLVVVVGGGRGGGRTRGGTEHVGSVCSWRSGGREGGWRSHTLRGKVGRSCLEVALDEYGSAARRERESLSTFLAGRVSGNS